MPTRRFQVWLALGLFLAGCRKATPPEQRARPPQRSVPAATATAALPSPVVASESAVPGLRIKSGSIAGKTLWGFSDLAIDLATTRLEIVLAKGGAPLAQLLPTGALAVVNGGYFEADFRPSTWLINAGLELAPKLETQKGGVLALRSSRTYLGPLRALSFEPELAVQSFPLIVEGEGESGIHTDDGKRAARSVVCLVGDTLHFVLITAPRGDGPTLFESAALLRAPPPSGFGCRRALNLDGGASAGVWFAPQVPAKQRHPLAPVAYGIAIVPR